MKNCNLRKMFVRNFGFMFEPIFFLFFTRKKRKKLKISMMPWFLAGEKIHFSNQIFSNEINPRKNFEFFSKCRRNEKIRNAQSGKQMGCILLTDSYGVRTMNDSQFDYCCFLFRIWYAGRQAGRQQAVATAQRCIPCARILSRNYVWLSCVSGRASSA